ncbi:MAG TPA: MotA/TolQ/ExbB proton channel family protein [Burkholderiaceae bacterium]|jgi:hypothetical protein|nr:MotA/TolQ/ExbB proton channel family protein [Burkholderiaceae bacterium]
MIEVTGLESLLYEVSRVFLFPVMALIALALAYAVIALGAFVVEAWQRRRGTFCGLLSTLSRSNCVSLTDAAEPLRATSDDLELLIMKELEWPRVVSRTAPMLGLIATMIPMGPALLALGNNDAAAVGRNMVAAFSSVILALLAACISFFILTVRRRWLLQDLRLEERRNEARAGSD